MISPSQALAAIPSGLRDPLLNEFQHIVQNYCEHRWTPAELSGGKICEIVYTILNGYPTRTFASGPSKPARFVDACRALEAHSNVPRSFQILIPRMLPALYEIRNNRGVGHVGGDVDPNHMDATSVLAMTSWIVAELVRVFHNVSTLEAQACVDSLVERRTPLIWQQAGIKRVLNPKLKLKDQVLLLVSATAGIVPVERLYSWVEYDDRKYFNRLLAELHDSRMVELDKQGGIQILPPGSTYVQKKFPTQMLSP
jgi:hypothetical protein